MALRSVVLALAVLAIIWAKSAGTTAQPAEKEVDPTELLRVAYLNHFMTINGDADLSQIKLAPKVRKSADLIPIVIIPSLFGNKFEIKLVNRSSHWFCASNSDWYTLWFPNVETVFLPLAATCWLDNLSLDYNTSTHMSSWPQGVFWRVPDYGGVDSITYLDDAHQVGGWNVTIALLKQAGYTPGKNLRAAPYDWRISPYQYKDDFVRLKSLIEDTYTMNGNKSVALASLSMGGSYTVLFLNTFVSQTWKDKYIHSWTSFCGPFGGSPWMLAALASTYNVYTIPWFVLPVYTIREVVQSFGAAYWLLPFDQVYGDMPIALTPGMNYTAADFALMFEKTGNQNGVDLYSHMQFARTMQAPGVTTYCIHGYNLSTPHQLQYNGNDLYLAQMNFIYGDGDGTVPITGLNYCDTWQQEQPQPVKSFAIANMLHGTSVKNAQAIEIFMNVLGLEVDGNAK